MRHINLDTKRAGERSAGNLPARFDVAGAGIHRGRPVLWQRSPRTAPVLDPTYSAGNQSPPGPLLVEGNLSIPIRTETFRSLCRSKPLRKDAARNSVKLRTLAGIASGSRPEVAAGSPACNTSFWGCILLVV